MKPKRLTLTRLALALLPLLHAGQAHSGLLFWVGPPSGSWADASNWSGGVLPDSQDDVILDFADVQVVGRQAANTISSGQQLKLLDPAASLTVTGSARLHGFAVLAGSYINEGGGTSAQVLGFTGGRLGGASVTSVMGIASVGAQGGSRPVLGTGHTLSLSGDTRLLGSLSFESDTILMNRGRWLDVSTGMVNLETVGVTPGQGGADFDNQGVYIKGLGGTTTLGADVRFHNSGSLSVGAGRLSLLGGSSMGGTVTVQAGATLELGRGGVNSANHTLSGQIDNSGRILMSGGVVQADAGLQLLGVTELNGSRLNLGADSSFAALTLRSGQLAAVGTVSVASLVVAGDVTFSGAALRSNTSFINTGKLTLLDGAELQSPLATLTNQGTLAGNGGVRVAGSFSNLGVLAPGADGVIGSFQVTGNLVNTGAVHIDLARSAADRLSVSGNANLGGTLNLSVLDGQRLQRGSSFNVMSWGNRSAGSEFASLDFSQASGYRFATTYGATGLDVTVTAVPFNWTGAASGGFWDVVNNWNDGSDGRPGAGDTVLLGSANTVIRSGGSPVSIMQAAAVTGTGVLTINSGATFDLSSSASLGGLNLSGTFKNAGTALITGASTLSGATLSGTGTTRFAGALTLQGSNSALLGGQTLELAGTTTVTGSSGLSTGGASRIVNLGSWVDGSNANNSLSGGAAGSSANVFDNQGTFTKTTAFTTTIGNFGLAFNNSGSVKLDAGTLSLVGGGTSTGQIDIASGATLDFSGFVGSGTYNLNRTVNNAGTFQIRGRIVNAPDGLALGGNTVISGGRLNLGGNSQFDRFDFVGTGTLNNNGTLVVSGPTNWGGGTFTGSGNTRLEGPVSLASSSSSTLSDGTLVLAGTTTQTGTGGINTNGAGARIINEGSWLEQASGALGIGGASAFFDNPGSFRKTSAFTTTIGSFGLAFNNSGSVKVDAGTLSLVGGGTSTGQIDIASGATLDFSGLVDGGTYDLNRAVNNAGTFQIRGRIVNAPDGLALGSNTVISGGRLNLGGNSQFDRFDFVGNGRLNNNGTLVVSGPTNWGGGTFTGSGNTRLEGPVSLAGASTSTLSGGTLVLAGTTIQTGSGSINTGGGRLVNEGVWLEQATGNTSIGGSSAASFDNAGRFSKTSVFTTAIGSSGTAFNNTGTVEVQAGKLQVFSGFNNTGLVSIAAGAELQGNFSGFANAGTLAGDGTVRTADRLSNGGTLAAGGLNDAGTLSLVGGLTQETSGIFLVDLGSTAAGGFDVLTISGTASLAGTLAVNLLDGAHFNVGDSFTVMTWNQRLGNSQFASLDLSQAGGYGFATDYGANSLTLRVTTAVPEPGSWALMAVGLLALGYRARRKSKPAATTTPFTR